MTSYVIRFTIVAYLKQADDFITTAVVVKGSISELSGGWGWMEVEGGMGIPLPPALTLHRTVLPKLLTIVHLLN